jgi:hypothetical protein
MVSGQDVTKSLAYFLAYGPIIQGAQLALFWHGETRSAFLARTKASTCQLFPRRYYEIDSRSLERFPRAFPGTIAANLAVW